MTRFEKVENQISTLKHAVVNAEQEDFAMLFVKKINELKFIRGAMNIVDANKPASVHFGRSLAGAVYIFRDGGLVPYAPKN